MLLCEIVLGLNYNFLYIFYLMYFPQLKASNAGAEGGEDSSLSVSSMIKEIQGLKDKFKDDDQEQPSPFQVIFNYLLSVPILALCYCLR